MPRQRPGGADSPDSFKLLFANNPLPMWVYELETLRFLEVNEAATSQYGYSREEFLGMRITDIRPPEDAPRLRDHVAMPRPRLQHSGEWRHRRKDGHIFDVQITSHELPYAGRRAALVVAQDISQRKQAEAELLRLASIVESSDDAILSFAPDATILTWNPGAERIYGYSAGEVIGRSIDILVPPDRLGERVEVYDRLARSGRSVHFEAFRVRKDGTQIDVSVTLSPVKDGAGRMIGISGIGRDITERKRTEEALWKAKEAEQANQAKSEFLSRMSHELRTPLNAILGFAQLLELDALRPDQRQSVDHILTGGHHLLELINEVLDMARIEAGRLTLSLEPVSVPEVVQEALGLITPLAAKSGVLLKVESARAPGRYILADRQRIKQILLNLLSNAVKYNHPGGAVSLSCHEISKEKLRITVTDTGPGIPPERMARLFTPFERLGAEQTGVEGTGLGLALSKRLAEAMHGRLGAESRVGHGSVFWVEMELAESPVQLVEDDRHGASAPTPPDASSRTRTVLYVEDNLSNLELLQRLLAHRLGVTVLPAMQGRLAVDLAREHRPDLILLDLHLPDISGDRVLQRLQQDPATRRIPVVVISADAMPAEADRLLAAGARAYMTKPLDIRQFLDLVNGILHGPAQGRPGQARQ